MTGNMQDWEDMVLPSQGSCALVQSVEPGVRACGIYWAYVSLDQALDLSVLVFLVGEMEIILRSKLLWA